MTEALAFALKHWRWAAIGVLALMLGVQSGRLVNAKHDLVNARAALVNPATKKTWQSEAGALRADLTTCHGNVSRLDAALAAQNAAVAALKSDSNRRGQMLADALQSARKAAHEAQSKADRLAAFTPKGADVCERLLSVDRELSR